MENIAKAIKKVMQEVQNIEKNTTVWTWRNSYKAVSEKDVKKTIREAMIKNWLSILQTWVEWDIKIDRWEETNDYWTKTKQSVFTEVKTNYMLLHESWETIHLAWYWHWVDSQDKWAGKATTYALKNTLMNIFLVPAWEDTDNTHSEDIAVPQKNNNTNNDNLPWLKDENLSKIIDKVKDGKTITWNDVKSRYRVAKRYNDELNKYLTK